MNIIYFGTSHFAAEILSFLLSKNYSIRGIVTKPDRPQGRNREITPTPVKEIAKKFSISCFQPEKASTDEFAKTLVSFDPDLFLVVAYGEIIKTNLLEIPKKGSINVHASLLPKYRGASPIRRALMNGEEKTGITIIDLSPEMDAGDILGKEVIYVPDSMTFGELEAEMIQSSIKILPKILQEIEEGIVIKKPQKHDDASFAPKIKKEEMRISWKSPAYQIHNLVRALSPFPGAWTEIKIKNQIKRLKILQTKVLFSDHPQPGKILSYDEKSFVVSCGEGALCLLQLQLEGKKSMPFNDFVKGVEEPQILNAP